MRDLIDRQAAIDALKGLPTWWADEGGYYEEAQPPMVALLDPEDAVSAIENLPSVQPQLPEWAKKVEEYRQSAPQHIHNSLAWALYQVWKEITAEGGHDEH